MEWQQTFLLEKISFWGFEGLSPTEAYNLISNIVVY